MRQTIEPADCVRMPMIGGPVDGEWELLPAKAYARVFRKGCRYQIHWCFNNGLKYWFCTTDEALDFLSTQYIEDIYRGRRVITLSDGSEAVVVDHPMFSKCSAI